MEISEQVYEVKSPSRKIIMEDTNHDSNVRKRKGGEYASPSKPNKILADKLKIRNAISLSNKTSGAEKKYCCLALDTPLRTVKYLKNTLKIIPLSVPTNITDPAPATKKSAVSL